ncbi:MAG TPA: hypothetical protein DEO70_04970 [Bacteroidales bacterium]|nr:MAG: hypothetical protein A2X11_11640 [Bacteroidetes bacterium GWE2_42_24]OFY25506.1 MAG: hypothetical protein A2X09_06950 [Bacteroidetes bacterium GWF2_43_11]PKP23714.1 MAG: hypothetical protein CVU06_06855 [Bacteroidetes bacterium HGW-Bacteroidetes-22]HBZ66169.1 hypothetical protein [Bacteroidales bacterium]
MVYIYRITARIKSNKEYLLSTTKFINLAYKFLCPNLQPYISSITCLKGNKKKVAKTQPPLKYF